MTKRMLRCSRSARADQFPNIRYDTALLEKWWRFLRSEKKIHISSTFFPVCWPGHQEERVTFTSKQSADQWTRPKTTTTSQCRWFFVYSQLCTIIDFYFVPAPSFLYTVSFWSVDVHLPRSFSSSHLNCWHFLERARGRAGCLIFCQDLVTQHFSCRNSEGRIEIIRTEDESISTLSLSLLARK